MTAALTTSDLATLAQLARQLRVDSIRASTSASSGHPASSIRSLSRFPDEGQTLRSLFDQFIESWVCWREACEAVNRAYECWQQCEAAQRGLAFANYRVNLDREDQAARIYAMFAERVHKARAGCHV